MIRGFVGLLVVVAAVAATLFFADRPGTVTLVWQGWRIDTSVAVLVLALVAGTAILWLVLSLLWGVLGAPSRYFRRRRTAHHLHAYRVLTDGLVAIAAGDLRDAERLQRRAELSFAKAGHAPPPLTRLLAAQTALLRGDDPAAKAEFHKMLEQPETEFLGLRGLIVQALKEGDDPTALALTQRAQSLRPDAAWVLQSQLALETRAGEWRQATATLRAAIRKKAVTAADGRRHHATLLLARSRAAEREGRKRDMLAYAASAHKLDPGFVPAATAYADALGGGASGWRPIPRGLRAIETAWERGSHPTLAASYDRLLAAEAPMARLKRFERLVDLRPSDPDAHLAAATVALANQLWGEARRHLDAAGAAGPGPWSRQLCHLAAELEDGQHKDAAAGRRWLERAARAPADPAWVCSACGAEQPAWDPLCPSCQGFDTLAWRVPDRAAARDVTAPASPPVTAGLTLIDPVVPTLRSGSGDAAVSGAAAESAARGQGA